MRNRPEIDGLRAVAVLPVLFFHAGLGCPGGYVGVDVFFVISGYLITALVLRDLDAGTFNLFDFWERRIRRILPALSAMIIASAVAGWFIFLAEDYKEFGESTVAQALLVANIYFWKQSGYFQDTTEILPLAHTWSLAVEEQFYLLFPSLLYFLYRLGRRPLVAILGLIWVSSFGLCVYASYRSPSANFFLLPTRAWELLSGALLAAAPFPRNSARWLDEVLSWGGLFAILYAVFSYDLYTRFPGVSALLPCAGAAAIICSNQNQLTSAGKILSLRPLVFMGLISYSLYLIHWPLIVYSRYWLGGNVNFQHRILFLLVSVLLAILSWKYIENPFRKRTLLKSRSRVFVFAGSVTATLLAAGFIIWITHGIPKRLPLTVQGLRIYGNDEMAEIFKPYNIELKAVQSGELTEFGSGNKQRPIDLLVWGDSHAMALMPALQAFCKERNLRGVSALHFAMAPLLNTPSLNYADGIAFNNAVHKYIRENQVTSVLIAARWDKSFQQAANAQEYRDAMHATIGVLTHSGIRVWVMKSVPELSWHPTRSVAQSLIYGGEREALGPTMEEFRHSSQHTETLFEGLPSLGATVLDPAPFFADPKGRYRVAEHGKFLYWDRDHLTEHGALKLRPLFEPLFDQIKNDTAK